MTQTTSSSTHGGSGRASPRPRLLPSWLPALLLATLALLGLGIVGVMISTDDSTRLDTAVQAWMLGHQHPVVARLFLWASAIGGITGMRVFALAAAAWLWYRGRPSVAVVMLVAPVVAIGLFNVVKEIYTRPRPHGLGAPVDASYAFPSGHATTSAAVCCTLAYVLWREHIIGGVEALALAIVPPLVVGVSRLYLDVHWTTDVLGGWCAGLLVAVPCAALYDRDRRLRADGRGAFARIDAPPTPSSPQ